VVATSWLYLSVSIPREALAWATVELRGDGVELGLGVAAEVGALGQVLADKPIPVLVGASLPGRVRVTEEDLNPGRETASNAGKTTDRGNRGRPLTPISISKRERRRAHPLRPSPMEQMSTSTKATPESRDLMSTTPARPILPATKGFDCCRICGNGAVMTAEHVPPRAAFNKGTGRNVGLNEIIGPKALNSMDLGSGPFQQGGIKGYTLCSTCNSRTGKLWGPEYKEWANWFAALILQTEELCGDLEKLVGPLIVTDVVFRGIHPGRFVRQVLSMFLSISGGPELAQECPHLRSLVLGEPPRPLPEPLRLYLHGYAGGLGRFFGGNGVTQIDVVTGTSRRLMAIDFPPMAFVLLLDGPPLDIGLDITEFTTIDVRTSADLVGDIPIGYGYSPFPGDYRTKAKLVANLLSVDEL
jgi:hypothetical protein